jgi:hypothetical protein
VVFTCTKKKGVLGPASTSSTRKSNVFFFSVVYNGSDLDWIRKPTSSTCPGTLSGGRFAALTNADGSLTSTPVPAVNADPSSTGWVVGSVDVGTGSGSVLSVFKVTKDASGNPVLGGAQTIPVAPYSVPASAPQLASTATIDTLDSRLEHAVAGVDPRLGVTSIWTAHAVFGGAGSEVGEVSSGAGVVKSANARTGRVRYQSADATWRESRP